MVGPRRMVRLFYSNRTAELLVELASRVRAQQLRDGPLTPVSIVVPSVGVDSYVRMGIARECGIAANLNVALLTRFASELVRTTSGARLADAASLEDVAAQCDRGKRRKSGQSNSDQALQKRLRAFGLNTILEHVFSQYRPEAGSRSQ